MDFDDIRDAAQQYYTDELPYHNWQHVQDTIDAAEALMQRCEENDIDVDDELVYASLYLHDAGYHHDHEARGFDSKAYSASIARDELDNLGYPDQFINDVPNCILATHPDADYETVEEKLIRASDLRGMTADYDTFRDNALALRDEHEILHGEEPNRDEWVKGVVATLSYYLSQDIRLTDQHDNEKGFSVFHSNLGRNLGLFIHEFAPESWDPFSNN
jgi:predicted metal-dependent HD superfamily phosphohydrolase